MDNSIISPYTQALNAQTTKLEDYLDSGFKTIGIPADISQVESSKMNMLGKSSICFAIIGVAAIIFGFVISNLSIIIAGAAAIFSAWYLYMKGRQASRAEAYSGLSTKIFGEISVITDKVSSEWNSFISLQNDNLKKQIVSSTDPTNSKVSMIDKVETSPAVKVNLDQMQAELNKVAAGEDFSAYKQYLSKAYGTIKNEISAVETSQQSIYNTLSKAAV